MTRLEGVGLLPKIGKPGQYGKSVLPETVNHLVLIGHKKLPPPQKRQGGVVIKKQNYGIDYKKRA